MESNRQRRSRLSEGTPRVVYAAVLSAVAISCIAARPAWADPVAPSNTSPPSISGTPQQGDQLTADPGTWSGDTPITYSYSWSDGQTGNPITLTAADVGQSLSVTVTASNDAGPGTAPATSPTDGPVLALPPSPTGSPAITGKAQQGHTLTATNGAWNNNPTSYSYAWADCNASGSACATISGATASTYKLTAADVAGYATVTVTASNSGGHASLTSASVGPVLPPAPVNTLAPSVAGTPDEGDTLSVSSNGSWNNDPAKYSYAWERCDSSGSCSGIPGATSNSYTLSAADVGTTIACVVTASGKGGTGDASSAKTAVVAAAATPAGPLPTTVSLASPTTAVTNESVTFVATVTPSVSSITTSWGSVTFENGGAPIQGCANMTLPSDQSPSVACSTSFAASSVSLTAVFTPAAGSLLAGSVSPSETITIGPDSTSTALDASSTVNVGAATTYTATVTPPAARPGPVEPIGSVEFLDGGQPISSCANQPLTNGAATCTVTYAATGQHSITAQYLGDADFVGSTSPLEPVSAVPVSTDVLGTITATMEWAFYYTPTYTKVINLVVNGVSPGATVLVRCNGHGCPFGQHSAVLTKHTRCGKSAGMCFTHGSNYNVTPGFAGHRLAVGTRVTVEIIRPNWIGKSYRFTVRARRGPRIQIACLAPGGSVPGVGC